MLETHFSNADNGAVLVTIVDPARRGKLARIKVESADNRQVVVTIDGEQASIRRVAHHADRWIYVLNSARSTALWVGPVIGFGVGLVSALAIVFWS